MYMFIYGRAMCPSPPLCRFDARVIKPVLFPPHGKDNKKTVGFSP